MHETTFKPLTVETLPQRLSSVEAVAERVGGIPSAWKVRLP